MNGHTRHTFQHALLDLCHVTLVSSTLDIIASSDLRGHSKHDLG